ncbi:MAG TPA: tRNA (adenosine(37)-N6)-dimethylallyltransferase MiaA [Candidatus Paceibacterota bacterium]|nr:tRNA (adenosine(37)-N6)-dimethylallyltransferase MiaA [Candidatus Paceibacterota bacterium]
MKHANNKILIILGQTATGKSDLAIALAKKYNGAIISADSRQVYRGMDLGSGKVIRDTDASDFKSEGISHYLIDIADPKKDIFSVSDFLAQAKKALKIIEKNKQLPIICGGTGLYISALIENWQLPKIKPNFKLREELENLSTTNLFEKLKTLDPERAQSVDPANRRRLIRSLENTIQSGQPLPPLEKGEPLGEFLILGLKRDNQQLKKLIKLRLNRRLRLKMLDEIATLKNKGVSSERLESFGLEYRYLNRYLEGKINYQEMRNQLVSAIYHFAKRQNTWFKRIPNVYWFSSKRENKKAFKLVEDFLKN